MLYDNAYLHHDHIFKNITEKPTMIYKFFYAFLILFNFSALAFDPVVLNDERLAAGVNRQVWHTAIDTITTTHNPIIFGTFRDARVVLHPAKSIKDPAHIEVIAGPTTLYATMHNPDTNKPGLSRVNLRHHYLVETVSKDLTEVAKAVEVFIRFVHALAFNTQEPYPSSITFYTKERDQTLSDHLKVLGKGNTIYINTTSFIFSNVLSEHGKGKKALQWVFPSPLDTSSALSPAVSYFIQRDAAIAEEELRRAEAARKAELLKLHHLALEKRLHDIKIALETAEEARISEEQRLYKEKVKKEKAPVIQNMLTSIKTRRTGLKKDLDSALDDLLTLRNTPPPTTCGDTLEDLVVFQQALESILALHGALGNPFEYGVDQQIDDFIKERDETLSSLSALQDAIEMYTWAQTLEAQAAQNVLTVSTTYLDSQSYLEKARSGVLKASNVLSRLKEQISPQPQSNEDLLDSLRSRSKTLESELYRFHCTHKTVLYHPYYKKQYRIKYQTALKILEEALQKGTLPEYAVLESMVESLNKYIQTSRSPFRFTPEEISVTARDLNGTESSSIYLKFMTSTHSQPASSLLASLSTRADFLPTLMHILKGAGDDIIMRIFDLYMGRRHLSAPRFEFYPSSKITLEELATVTPEQIVEWFSNKFEIDPLEAGLLMEKR